MKELIEKSGLKLSEFSEKYGIPYNTVRQWYNGERKAPSYLANLIKAKDDYKPLLELNKPDIFIYEYYTEDGLKYRAHLPKDKTEEQRDWFNKCQQKFKDKEDGLIKRKIYKAYLIGE